MEENEWLNESDLENLNARTYFKLVHNLRLQNAGC